MAAWRKPASDTVYQLKISLRGARPPIWRRLLVRGDTDLGTLHGLIQTAMGWEDYHLHQFTVDRTNYGNPAQLGYGEIEATDEGKVTLDQLTLSEKAKFTYEYDFGDGWGHQILVEKRLQADPAVRYPTLVAGKRACPPEDVGGIWRYAWFIEVMKNPTHDEYREEYEELREWIGDDFDPDAFSVDEANARIDWARR